MLGHIYISFDIDWASEDLLNWTLDFIEPYNIKATFFVTNETPALARIRKNQNYELGVHPNFLPLFGGIEPSSQHLAPSSEEKHNHIGWILDDILSIVPDAKCVRSHSLVAGSTLSALYYNKGLLLESSFIYHGSDIPEPYYDVSGMLRCFHFWEDDAHFSYVDQGIEHDWNVKRILSAEGVKIFDFHPIHLFLNTDTSKTYLNAKPFNNNFKKLSSYVNNSPNGTLTFFKSLMDEMNKNELQTRKMIDLLEVYPK